MVLSNVNVAKTSGNGSSTVIRKIHNMPWLKQATDPKNSDQGRATSRAMFQPLANLKEDEQKASAKKSKRRNKKSRNLKQRTDVPKNTEITIKSNETAARSNARVADDLVTKDSQLLVAGGQSGIGKGVWSTDKNTVGELFPGAAEAARTQQLEEEQMKMAVAASLESAFLEKCGIDLPEEDNVEAAKLSDDENIWDGVHKNLPSPSGEETVGDFDANNNSGLNKSRSSSVATRKSDGKDSSCEGSKAAAIDPPSIAGTIDEPPAPAVVPKFIDKFGRPDGYNEKRMYMGRGARWREDEYRRNLQQNHGDSSNDPNQRPRNNGGSRNHRPRNARYSAGNSRNDNRGTGNGSNDPRCSRHARQFVDNPRNEPRGPSPQTVIAQLTQQQQQRNQQQQPQQQQQRNQQPQQQQPQQRNQQHQPQQQQQPQLQQRPQPQQQQRLQPHQQQQQRGSQSTQVPQRLRNHQAEEDARNDRQQGRSSRPENLDCRYRYTEPYDTTKNPYKYVRASDDGDKRMSDKSDREHENRTNNANRDGDEKKIHPLMLLTVEPLSTAANQESARESSTPIDRPLAETPGEPPINVEPGVSPKETTEFAGDPVRPPVQLSDFNHRYKTPPEHATVPTRPNPACSTNCSHATTIGHTCMAAMQCPPAQFSIVPPGFACLENTQGSSGNAAFVLPVDSSIGCSAYVVPAKSSRTSSAYCASADSASDSFSEVEEMDAVYARLKIYDPMLYDLLMKRGQRTAARLNHEMHAIGYPTIPENCNVLPVDPRGFQGTTSYVASAEQPSEMNPNSKQYSPISKKAWISHHQQDPMSCYSVPQSYDPQSTGVYCQYMGQPQEMILQDNSGWIPAGPQHYAAVHPAQHHGHYANEPTAPTAPTALGRQSYLVSEHNLSYKNAQRPMNLQQLNDDYPIRCQTSGFDDNSTDPQRQMQYRVSHRQCGVAPGQYCSMPCEGSYGNQTAMSKRVSCVQHAPYPLQEYNDFVLNNQNSMNSMNRGNVCFYKDNVEHIPEVAQQGCGAREQNVINQPGLKFLQPTIRPMSFGGKPPVPGNGLGRGRLDNKK